MSFIEIRISIPEDNDGSEPAVNTVTGEPYQFGLDLARSIRDRLLDEELSTNGHIYDPYETSYKWEGERYTRLERPLILKVDPANKERIIEIVTEMHPYKTPSITTNNVEALTKDYGSWLEGKPGSVADQDAPVPEN